MKSLGLWQDGAMDMLRIPATLCCGGTAAPDLDEVEAENLVAMLKALADPVRLRLVHIIARDGELCACDLPALLDRSQPTISHHLKVLVEAGLLSRDKRGKWAWFQVRHDQMQRLSDSLDTGSAVQANS